MKAIVYDVVGAPALVRDVAEPDCPEDGAVITVRATGICRSDWHAWRGNEPVPLPHIPGHEFAGVILLWEPRSPASRRVTGDRAIRQRLRAVRLVPAGDAQSVPIKPSRGSATRARSLNASLFGSLTSILCGCPMNWISWPRRRLAAALPPRSVPSPRTAGSSRKTGWWCSARWCRAFGDHDRPGPGCPGDRCGPLGGGPGAGGRVGCGSDRRSGTSTAIAELTGAGAHMTVDALGSAATALAAVTGLRRGRPARSGGIDARRRAWHLPWELLVARELRVAGSHGMSAADYPAMLAMIPTAGSIRGRARSRTHPARRRARR